MPATTRMHTPLAAGTTRRREPRRTGNDDNANGFSKGRLGHARPHPFENGGQRLGGARAQCVERTQDRNRGARDPSPLLVPHGTKVYLKDFRRHRSARAVSGGSSSHPIRQVSFKSMLVYQWLRWAARDRTARGEARASGPVPKGGIRRGEESSGSSQCLPQDMDTWRWPLPPRRPLPHGRWDYLGETFVFEVFVAWQVCIFFNHFINVAF